MIDGIYFDQDNEVLAGILELWRERYPKYQHMIFDVSVEKNKNWWIPHENLLGRKWVEEYNGNAR